MKAIKTVELITPMCAHGKAKAVICDGDREFVTEVHRMREGDPIHPGETMLTVAPIEGGPINKRRVVDEYTRPGPSRAASPAYRKGYDDIEWN